jgi:subtilisin family serine protease
MHARSMFLPLKMSKTYSMGVIRNQNIRSRTIQNVTVWSLGMLTYPYQDYDYEYKYTGKGVRAFVLDSGLDFTHEQFGGRAGCGWDAFGGNCEDKEGHGTHVAGTIGSTRYGAAKNVSLIGLKVLDDNGSGSLDTVLKAIDWVIGRKRTSPKVPMVINMSLGGMYTSLGNAAVKSATNRGITVVVAAGNNFGGDACDLSPASAASAITVGSTDFYNWVSYFSNGGSCVDIMAPGSLITSVTSCDKYSECNRSTTLSGTSMSAPLVAGIAALHLQKKKTLTPSQVWAAIKADARRGEILDYWKYDVPDLLLSAKRILK